MNKEQEIQHRLNYRSREVQQAGKSSKNVTTFNYYNFNNTASSFNVHNHAMVYVAAMFKDRNHGDNACKSGVQKEKNSTLVNAKVRLVKQAENGKGGDINAYHIKFRKISSNLDKRTPKNNLQPKFQHL